MALSAALMGVTSPAMGDTWATPVTVTRAQSADLPSLISAAGTIAPWQEAHVDAEIQGSPVVDVRVQVGIFVHKGEVLARFDDTRARAQVEAAEADLAAAEATAAETAFARDRSDRLSGTGALSQQAILQAKLRADGADAQVLAARAQLKLAQWTLAHTQITAPDDGVISSRTVELGFTPASGTELFRLIRQNRLQWRAEVTADQLARISTATVGHVEIPGGASCQATVDAIAPSVDHQTRLGLVYMDLKHCPSAKAGQYVKGSLENGKHPAVMVPSESLVTREGRTFLVSLQNDHAHLLAVRVGTRGPEATEILEGVLAGTTVIVRGAGFLSEGTPVRIVNAGAQ